MASQFFMGIGGSNFDCGFNSTIAYIPISWSDTKLHLLGSLSNIQNNVPPNLTYIMNNFSSATLF